MKDKIKNLIYLTPLFINNVFADDFFDDYPLISFSTSVSRLNQTQQNNVVSAANTFLATGYQILKWVWLGLLLFTITNIIMTTVRLVIHSDDWVAKKMNDKHELFNEFIALAILGGIPTIYMLIMALLKLSSN